jgi:hypothetical protein
MRQHTQLTQHLEGKTLTLVKRNNEIVRVRCVYVLLIVSHRHKLLGFPGTFLSYSRCFIRDLVLGH